MSRPDICTREDIDALLREFYAEAMADAVIGYLFTDVAKLDLEAHLPVIGAFWETVLLDRPVYRGNPMRLHQALHAASALRAEHFQRWFAIWAVTIDARFDGPVATDAKRRAASSPRPCSATSASCRARRCSDSRTVRPWGFRQAERQQDLSPAPHPGHAAP